MWKKTGGVGKEWDFGVCMSVCSFRPWELAGGRKGRRAKSGRCVLYLRILL